MFYYTLHGLDFYRTELIVSYQNKPEGETQLLFLPRLCVSHVSKAEYLMLMKLSDSNGSSSTTELLLESI